MASLDDIQKLLTQIRNDLPGLINQSRIAPKQVVITSGLSDLSERLGLLMAGEFRAGNAKEPGFGFTGVRMGFPPFSYGGDMYNIVGVSSDVLQFGLSASNGKAYFAAGAGIIDSDGLHLRAEAFPSVNVMDWVADDDGEVVSILLGWYVNNTASGVYVVGRGKTAAERGVSGLAAMTYDQSIGSYKTLLELQSDGDVLLDLENATNDGVGQQALNIKTKVNVTDQANTVAYLDTKSKGTPANGLGTALVLRAANSAGEMTTIGYLAAIYTDVTDGLEDSKVVVGHMVNGSLTEVQLAP